MHLKGFHFDVNLHKYFPLLSPVLNDKQVQRLKTENPPLRKRLFRIDLYNLFSRIFRNAFPFSHIRESLFCLIE